MGVIEPSGREVIPSGQMVLGSASIGSPTGPSYPKLVAPCGDVQAVFAAKVWVLIYVACESIPISGFRSPSPPSAPSIGCPVLGGLRRHLRDSGSYLR